MLQKGTAMFSTRGHGVNKLFRDKGDWNQTLGGVDGNYSNVELCRLQVIQEEECAVRTLSMEETGVS